MNKEIATKGPRAAKSGGIAKVGSLMPEGSWQRTALGVAIAAGGGLVATALIGVGPVAIAGAAGYLAYREMTKSRGDKTAHAG